VRASIEEWALTVEDPGNEQADDRLRPLLPRQGVLWQTVLTGEKAAHELLESMTTSMPRSASRTIRTTVRSALKRFWLFVTVIVLLFAASVALPVTQRQRHGGARRRRRDRGVLGLRRRRGRRGRAVRGRPASRMCVDAGRPAYRLTARVPRTGE
jgi:hypothetical protein